MSTQLMTMSSKTYKFEKWYIKDKFQKKNNSKRGEFLCDISFSRTVTYWKWHIEGKVKIQKSWKNKICALRKQIKTLQIWIFSMIKLFFANFFFLRWSLRRYCWLLHGICSALCCHSNGKSIRNTNFNIFQNKIIKLILILMF